MQKLQETMFQKQAQNKPTRWDDFWGEGTVTALFGLAYSGPLSFFVPWTLGWWPKPRAGSGPTDGGFVGGLGMEPYESETSSLSKKP